VLIGEYAKAALPASAVPKIVTPDGLTVSELRHAGFIEGFGIPDSDPSIVCKKPTMGSDTTGEAAMDACLAVSMDVNIIYTVNEPVAAGAYASLVAAGIDPTGVIILRPFYAEGWGFGPAPSPSSSALVASKNKPSPRSVARSIQRCFGRRPSAPVAPGGAAARSGVPTHVFGNAGPRAGRLRRGLAAALRAGAGA